MKTYNKIGILIFSGAVLIACNSGMNRENVKTEDATEVNTKDASDHEFAIDTSKSIIEWKGTKPTGEHVGTIHFKEGKIQVKNGNLVGGKFTINMISIVNKDIADAEMNKKLVDHLNSADFFNTAQFPESTFEITSVKPYESEEVESAIQPSHWITGNLTIKDISKSVTVPTTIKIEDTLLLVTTAEFFIDRTEWDIQYKSRKFFDDLKDKFIYDEIGLTLRIASKMK